MLARFLLISGFFLLSAGTIPAALGAEATFDPATLSQEDFRFKPFEELILEPPADLRVSQDYADLLDRILSRFFAAGTPVGELTAFMETQASFPTVKQEDRWLRPKKRLTIKQAGDYMKYSYRFVISKRMLKKYMDKYTGNDREQVRLFHMEGNIFTWVILADLDGGDQIKRLRIRLEGLHH